MQSLEHRISPFFWFGYYLNKYVHHFHRKFRGLGTAISQTCLVCLHVQEVILTESNYFEETRKTHENTPDDFSICTTKPTCKILNKKFKIFMLI